MLLKCAGLPLGWEDTASRGSEVAGRGALIFSALPCCTCAGDTTWEVATGRKCKPESRLEVLL